MTRNFDGNVKRKGYKTLSIETKTKEKIIDRCPKGMTYTTFVEILIDLFDPQKEKKKMMDKYLAKKTGRMNNFSIGLR